MRFILFILAFSVYFSGNSCGQHNKANHQDIQALKMDFDSTILVIHKKVVDLTSPDDLFAVQEFTNLYEHPDSYQQDVIKFISRDDRTEEQKLIAIYSLQRSGVHDYINVLKESVQLFERGEISEGILSNIISAPIGKNYIVIKNYSNKDVQSLLSKLNRNDRVSENFRYRINNILTGDAWENIQDLPR